MNILTFSTGFNGHCAGDGMLRHYRAPKEVVSESEVWEGDV